MKKGDLIQVCIETLAFGGAGIGRYISQERPITVFVSDTVPGDMVEASLTKIKPNYWEARLVKILTPSPDRIAPRCKHFGLCGGCTWQFLPYEKQLEFKESQVRESLQHIGKFENPSVEKIIGCAEPWFYRNKMELSFGSADETKLGFHLRGMRYEVFDLEECFLESEFFPRFVNAFRIFIREHEWRTFHERSHTGFLKSLFVREAKNTPHRMLNLVTQGEIFDTQKQALFRHFVKTQFPDVTSLYCTEVIQKKGQRTQFQEHHLAGKTTLTEKLILDYKSQQSSLTFEIAPQAFFQPNTLQAQILYSKVLECADLNDNDIVFDLFCGTGTIGLFCAKKAKYVFGVELQKEAIESARQNARLNTVSNIDFFVGDVADALQHIKQTPSCVVVDPPRAGLGEKVVHQIVALQPKKIVSVSCNPTTFSRDAALFCDFGYTLQRVIPVDMFPQTYHIETVALFCHE